jgi:hypothetical protein
LGGLNDANIGFDIIAAPGVEPSAQAKSMEGEAAEGPLAGLIGTAASAILPSMVHSSDDFYPTVALTALLLILGDESLSLQHNSVLQATMLIFRSLGSRSLQFLPQVVPAFLSVLKNTGIRTAARGPRQGGMGLQGGFFI